MEAEIRNSARCEKKVRSRKGLGTERALFRCSGLAVEKKLQNSTGRDSAGRL
jgi:hypothetical protein